MKAIIIGLFLFTTTSLCAQIKTPSLSPSAKIEQKVGLTDIVINYSRPGKRERIIFGELVPFGEIWRTGANKNTLISFSDAVIFGTDTLAKGEYSIYTLPNEKEWDIIFYETTDNWGNPDEWKEELIVLKLSVDLSTLNDEVETFTISLDNLTTKSAVLSFSWDHIKASVKFDVPTDQKVEAAIEKVMGGPSANDYYNAADHLLTEKKDLEKALEWISKAVELRGEEAFWMTYKKALIQAELGDYKGAIESSKLSMKAAEAANYQSYIDRNKVAIEKWSKKK